MKRSPNPRRGAPVTQTTVLPDTFQIRFSRSGGGRRILLASQILPLPRKKAFVFFQDPRNLFEITPPWLDFRMQEPRRHGVFEGAEFDYTIRWLGVRIPWRSRIEAYCPPEQFADLQVRGPYRYWRHLHRFTEDVAGTRMEDEVTYRLPFPALSPLVHRWLVRRQLYHIFAYRAVRIDAWARGAWRPRAPGE